MTGSIYRRMGQLLFNFWPYILVSTISAFIFVLLNSASIWLTASFINNVLTDFDKIVQYMVVGFILFHNRKITIALRFPLMLINQS